MTPAQLTLIHTAKRRLTLDDADYRTILRTIGHVESSKDLTNDSFEAVMAFFESRGYRHPKGDTYWRDKAGRQGRFVSARMVRYIETLAAKTDYQLPGLCRRLSNQRTDRLDQLHPGEAYAVAEALKAIIARSTSCPRASVPPCLTPDPDPMTDDDVPF